MKSIRFKDYLIDYLEFNNITNKDFANRIGITPKHLISILSGEVDLSSEIIDRISLVTDIPTEYIYKVELNYKFENIIKDYLSKNNMTVSQFLNKFSFKNLVKSDYIDFTDVEDKMENIKDILKFLRVSSPEKIYEIDSAAFYKSNNDKQELLLLWLEKCYRETLKQNLSETYCKENINFLLEYVLNSARKNELEEKNLIKVFNKNGVYLVIQDDIATSKIRGAFKVHRGIPAIYLTHKYQRIADIYFALLHELAHCKTDFNKAQAMSLVSYYDKVDESEERADKQAFDWMVDDEYYNKVCLSEDYDIEKEIIYPKAFVVYRLAKDGIIEYNSKIYQKYNPVVIK